MAREGDENEKLVELSWKATTSHKREFQFALESQFEIGESLSRLRARKRVTESNSDVTVTDCDRDRDTDIVEDETMVRDDKVTDCDKRKEKGKEKVNGVPTKLKELLDTKLLDGLNVWYIRGIKSGQSSKGLAGMIIGTGILCFCDECKGVQIVSPNQFEVHAGSANKRPADHIYLENGNTLRDVLNACKHATFDCVTTAILNAISSSPHHNSAFSPSFTEPIYEARGDMMRMLCGSSSELNAPQTTSKPAADTNESTSTSTDRSVQCASLHITHTTTAKGNSSSTKSQGKITRKDLRLHKLVFQDDVLPDGTELGYYVQGKKLLSGYKKGSGIWCECCNAVVSPSQFESHAGCASRRKPYLQIYTSNGMSLHEISVKISKECGLSKDEKDDLCSVCQGDGDLLCCDGCPRVFHLQCASLSSIPNDKWYCKLCDENFQMERFAERNPNAIAAGRVPGVDAMEQITNRCIRFFKNIDPQYSACALCRIHDFCRSGFGPRTVIICDQCEKEYHVGCLKEHDMQDLKELPVGDWFCSFDCESVNYTLKELLKKGDQTLPDDLVHVIKKKLTEEESNGDNLDIRWRVLHGRKSFSDESLPLLSKAVSVFHEKFDPILYGANKQDLIPHMVYGRNVKETELSGMYCAVLSINSTIVSAGVFRVFSKDVAEIPLIATSKGCEGKGYFQCLYSCVEKFLKDLGVKNLFLPAAEDTRSMWINRFGFKVMPQELNQLKTLYPLMHFDGTSMLRKMLMQKQSLSYLLGLCS